jgi:RES domain-containing protein
MPAQRVRVVRIHRRAREANNYEGSLLYANRWNPIGTPMRYASTTLSLCCLEALVHTVDVTIIPALVWSYAELDDIKPLDLRWNLLHNESLTRQMGHDWINSGNELATLVPSIIIPVEYNALLNPTHQRYEEIRWSAPQPFPWDRRLIQMVRGTPAAD